MEIKGRFDHFNFNVLDLEKSIRFYEKALGLKEVRRKTASDGSFILVYMGDGETSFTLELTWLRDRKEPYDLGEGEYFRVEMVRVGMGRQNIQPSGAFQKVPVYIKLRGIPIIIDQNGKFFAFNNKATVVDINKSHRFHVANIYLFG